MKNTHTLALIASLRRHNRKEHERALSQIVQSIHGYTMQIEEQERSRNQIMQSKKLDAAQIKVAAYLEETKQSVEPMLHRKQEEMEEKRSIYLQAKNEETVITNVIDARKRMDDRERIKKQQIQLEEIALVVQRKKHEKNS